MSLEQKRLTACHQRKTSHFIPIFKLSITYHHIIRMKDFDNTSLNEAKIPKILVLLINVSKWKIPSFSLLTGLLASYICSALYLLHTETNSRSLSVLQRLILSTWIGGWRTSSRPPLSSYSPSHSGCSLQRGTRNKLRPLTTLHKNAGFCENSLRTLDLCQTR